MRPQLVRVIFQHTAPEIIQVFANQPTRYRPHKEISLRRRIKDAGIEHDDRRLSHQRRQ
jgi:hypothetical protein